MKSNLLESLPSILAGLLMLLLMLQIQTVVSNRDDVNARRLYNNLMANYNRLVRPVYASDEDVNVSIGLKMMQFNLVSFVFPFLSISRYYSSS